MMEDHVLVIPSRVRQRMELTKRCTSPWRMGKLVIILLTHNRGTVGERPL